MAEPFLWPVRVYWEDTDAGGVVYHANYLAFMERARTEWMRRYGFGQELLRQRDDLVFVVRAMHTDFLAPARLDDALQVSVRLTGIGGASLRIAQEVSRDGQPLARASVRVASLSASRFRPARMGDTLLDTLTPLVETV